MKKITILIALCLLLSFGAALADDPVSIRITPLDYQTGKAVSKAGYVENEMFSLRVDVDVPRFTDLDDMEMVVEIDGVELEFCDVDLADGTYYITGIVTGQPAAITVKAKDMAYDNADTAEELYNALRSDRTVSATYYFYQTASASILIPKTGGSSILAPLLVIAGLCVIALSGGKRRR